MVVVRHKQYHYSSNNNKIIVVLRSILTAMAAATTLQLLSSSSSSILFVSAWTKSAQQPRLRMSTALSARTFSKLLTYRQSVHEFNGANSLRKYRNVMYGTPTTRNVIQLFTTNVPSSSNDGTLNGNNTVVTTKSSILLETDVTTTVTLQQSTVNTTLSMVDISKVETDSNGSPPSTANPTATTPIINVDTSNICGSSILAIDPADIVISIEPSIGGSGNTPMEPVVNGSNSSSSGTGTAKTAAVSSSSQPVPSQSEILRRLPFVSMFRGSANYIANHRNTVAVYHIPGGLLCNENNNTLSISSPPPSETEMIFRDLMNDVALTWLLGIKIVIVVGCRHQIEQRLMERQKRQQPQHQAPSMTSTTTTAPLPTTENYDVITSQHGLRVTSPEILRIVKEEAGYVRFEVERQLARSLRLQGGGTAATAVTSNGNAIPSSNGGGGGGGFIDTIKGKLPPSSGNGATSNGNSGTVSAYFDGNVVSGNFFSAQPFGILDGVDYQYTGFVRRVEVEKIRQLHASRDICLLTTLGVSPSGEVFNVNSESLAAIVAGAMEASKVVYFTEKEVYLRHKVHMNKIQSLRLKDGLNFLNYYGIQMHSKGFVTMSNGVEEQERRKTLTPEKLDMLLKVGWCTGAIGLGVKRAHIITPQHGALLQELYTRDGSGTLISADLYEGIRRATVLDVSAIHAIIAPLIAAGTLIDRPKAQLEKDIDQYYIYTRDKDIIACGQLKKFEKGFAEIGCLVVNKDFRSRGRGDAMLGYLERLSLLNECTNIFVLSTQTMEWFVERGFDEAIVAQLPPSRQATYNHKRASKIYVKKIESDRDLDASELWWNR